MKKLKDPRIMTTMELQREVRRGRRPHPLGAEIEELKAEIERLHRAYYNATGAGCEPDEGVGK